MKTKNENRTVADGFLIIFSAAIAMLIMSLATCNDAKAQQEDSMNIHTAQMQMMTITNEQAIGFISKNLRIAHNEFRTGWITCAVGSGLLLASAAMNNETLSNNGHTVHRNNYKQLTAIIGSVAALSGIVMIIDSHNKIGNCGNIYITPLGLVLKFNK
jgi:hypothetical protein